MMSSDLFGIPQRCGFLLRRLLGYSWSTVEALRSFRSVDLPPDAEQYSREVQPPRPTVANAAALVSRLPHTAAHRLPRLWERVAAQLEDTEVEEKYSPKTATVRQSVFVIDVSSRVTAEFGSMGSRRLPRSSTRVAESVIRFACPLGPVPLAARGLTAVLARAAPAGALVTNQATILGYLTEVISPTFTRVGHVQNG